MFTWVEISSKHRAVVLMNHRSDQGQNLTGLDTFISTVSCRDVSGPHMVWSLPPQCCRRGILKGEINNLSAVTPGSTFHFQISSIAAAAPSSSVLNITFSSVCSVRFLYSSGWSVAPGLFIRLIKDTYKLTVLRVWSHQSPEEVCNRELVQTVSWQGSGLKQMKRRKMNFSQMKMELGS